MKTATKCRRRGSSGRAVVTAIATVTLIPGQVIAVIAGRRTPAPHRHIRLHRRPLDIVAKMTVAATIGGGRCHVPQS